MCFSKSETKGLITQAFYKMVHIVEHKPSHTLKEEPVILHYITMQLINRCTSSHLTLQIIIIIIFTNSKFVVTLCPVSLLAPFFPTAFAHLLSLCHILLILKIFQTFKNIFIGGQLIYNGCQSQVYRLFFLGLSYWRI